MERLKLKWQRPQPLVPDGTPHFHANAKKFRRWPGVVALLLIGAIFAVLSERLTIGPGWLMPGIILIMLGVIIASRIRGVSHRTTHLLVLGAIGIVTLAMIASISLLVLTLPDKSVPALSLLRDAALLWSGNVLVFALWYWQIDGGGPVQRLHDPDYRRHSAFLFPQLVEGCPGVTELEQWRPIFADYLFIAFNTSTAFSPTDTPVLSTLAKVLSMLQAAISLVTLATLAARAINIL